MDKATYQAALYLAGWRIANAYLYGMSDAGQYPGEDAYHYFGDAYAVHYRDQILSPVPNVQMVDAAFKQWKLMQTMGKDEPKETPLEKCETDNG